jgi:hypothetical protein|tara:strand:+ start:347 stop:586 length:240 start_codon:yes stop_codon:yes gene_type:complete
MSMDAEQQAKENLQRYLDELDEKLKYERMVERREEKIRSLRLQLAESEHLLRKAQRSVMYDEIQDYFERGRTSDNKRNL